MINIVIPIAATRLEDENEVFQYPLPLVEILGKSLIEYSLDVFECLNEPKRFTFVLKEKDCKKYHLDSSLKLLVPECSIVKLSGNTRGSICSVLMSIHLLDMNSECIITNYDQFIDYDISKALNYFRKAKADGGLITFNSIHPRWSFVSVNNDDVIQTAEKNPISNLAIAGFYYFKRFSDFVDGAFKSIQFDENYRNNYFTSSVFNQMILSSKLIKNYTIPKNQYHSFYSPQKISEFENHMRKK